MLSVLNKLSISKDTGSHAAVRGVQNKDNFESKLSCTQAGEISTEVLAVGQIWLNNATDLSSPSIFSLEHVCSIHKP